ncbi:hypothetical protein GW835_00235 [archaeon]|nr:hypothetical protein [archaeon]NCP78985.1 hypothetical protein [archaeon]NCP97632.1 hypothetical protein [archaeon]NCQ06752.1 hypothetical protein [archaeon]NCQ50548.1 hypothetical protein [archaeon]
MANIKSKDSFSWSKGSTNYSYNQRGNDSPVSLSKIVTDIRKLQRLLSISLNSLDREDLTALKKDISYLQHSISDNISKKDVPSNIERDYDRLNEDVRDKISEIDKRILS